MPLIDAEAVSKAVAEKLRSGATMVDARGTDVIGCVAIILMRDGEYASVDLTEQNMHSAALVGAVEAWKLKFIARSAGDPE